MPTTKGDADERLALVRKVLELERKQGFQDRAVIGGLEGFISRHLPEGRELVGGYRAADLAHRAQALERLEQLLAELEGGQAQPRELHRPIEELPGVGEKRALLLKKLGIHTIEDLLTYFPRRLEDRSRRKRIGELRPGDEVTVTGTVKAKSRMRVRPHLELIKVAVDDGTGFLFAIWYNQPWVWEELRQGERYAFFGKVQSRYGELQMENPVWEPAGADFYTGRWVPIYPTTEGLTQATLQWLIQRALRRYGRVIPELFPQELRRRWGLLPRAEAIKRIHSPAGPEDYERARRTLAFEELLLLQVGLLLRERGEAGRALAVDRKLLKKFLAQLPFSLTPSQKRALAAIEEDLKAPRTMLRLLQGDVGSGKTVVAAGACVLTISAGAQAAVMAPTEILAQQHFLVLRELLSPLPLRVELLAGGLPPKQREKLLREISAGEVQLVVGTHALIQEDVEFSDLGLAVVDEQHRFGVIQRAALEQKGRGTNILVMSATPIPRTVVLTLYGQFEVSVLEEMPLPRERVRTVWVSESRREEVYQEIGELLAKGEKGYVIFPLVEESEELDLRAATEAYMELSRRFPGVKVGLLHGRLSSEEKQSVMAAFRAGEVQLLVATTVVEVGLDVPDASFLVIEHADRFGLAQLHQLRGRIGRGGQEAVCFAIADPKTEEARKRLTAFRDISDGFKIAEADLRIRGPGDLLGTAQHGFVSRLRAANLVRDVGLLERARAAARQLLAQGVPERLRREVERRFGEELELLGV
jgi:ATP-dependent DNA helicase RecG